MERERYRPERCRDLDREDDLDLDLDLEMALHRVVRLNSIGGERSAGVSYYTKESNINYNYYCD